MVCTRQSKASEPRLSGRADRAGRDANDEQAAETKLPGSGTAVTVMDAMEL